MPSQASYTRLSSSPTSVVESFDLYEHDGRHPPPSRSRETVAWTLFVSCCILAIALSAVNLSYLSVSKSISRSSTQVIKRPSVYLGLETVVFDPPYCRSRGTFPKAFSTYNEHDPSNLQRVHAPDDKATLSFGGPIRSAVDIYMPDHGLENCTLSVRHVEDPYPLPSRNIDVYLLPDPDNLSHKVFLDTLEFAPNKEATSPPFYCPSRSHGFFELRCVEEGCMIQFPLEGVTSLTASAESLSKTGFRVTQYEALRCIPS